MLQGLFDAAYIIRTHESRYVCDIFRKIGCVGKIFIGFIQNYINLKFGVDRKDCKYIIIDMTRASRVYSWRFLCYIELLCRPDTERKPVYLEVKIIGKTEKKMR